MDQATKESGGSVDAHARWVRVIHWLVAASVLTLSCSGIAILMVHPRLYWGQVGNDLTPPLIELPISRNYRHGGWTAPQPFFAERVAGPVSASRTYDIFNQNGWARSLHFLAAWWLTLPGLAYLAAGFAGGHFRKHLVPRARDLAPANLWQDVIAHVRFRILPASGGSRYGVLQKCAYTLVVFVLAPAMVFTGLAMSPAVTAAYPVLLDIFGGYHSARTLHFFASATLLLFLMVHVVMVVASGFTRQMRGMTLGR